MSGQKGNSAERLVPCSFCNEELLPAAIGEHLMMCGNKTDQCPNCKKYIRRAIFAYHYENQCANLDEIEDDAGAAAKRSEIPSTFQPNRQSESPQKVVTENNKHTTFVNVDISNHPESRTATPQRSNFETTTMVCPYCGYEYDPLDSVQHEENCLRHPKNMAKRQPLQINDTFNHSTGRSIPIEQSNDDTEVPCECCKKLIKWRDYRYHTQACIVQHYPPVQEQPGDAYRADDPAGDRCKYCYKQYMVPCVEQHQRNCKQNPLNIAMEEQHRAIFSPPSVYIRL